MKAKRATDRRDGGGDDNGSDAPPTITLPYVPRSADDRDRGLGGGGGGVRRWVDRLIGIAAGVCLSAAIRGLGGGGGDRTAIEGGSSLSGASKARSSSFPVAAAAEESCVGPDGAPLPCNPSGEAFSVDGGGVGGEELPGCTIGNHHRYEIGSYNFSWLHAKKNFYAVPPGAADGGGGGGGGDSGGKTMRKDGRARPQCKRIAAHSLTPDKMFQRHFMRSQPVVLEGAWSSHVENDEFASNWTLDEIARRWGNEIPIDTMWSDDNIFQRVERVPGMGYRYVQPYYTIMKFADFVRDFEAQERMMRRLRRREGEIMAEREPLPKEYINLQQLAMYELLTGWKNITERLSLPPLPPVHRLMEKDLNSVRLWIAGRGKVSKLHVDNYDNILALISGTKTIFLVDPIHLHRLYPSEVPFYLNERLEPGRYRRRRIKMRIRHFSPVDVLDPDLDRFPLFRHVEENNLVLECRLNPGDLLLLPALWWHEVHNDIPEGSYRRGRKKKRREHEEADDDDGGEEEVPFEGGTAEAGEEKGEEGDSSGVGHVDNSNYDDENDEVGANIAINYWYRAHSLLTRYHSMTMDNVAMDWVSRGRECDERFEADSRRRQLLSHSIEVSEEPGG